MFANVPLDAVHKMVFVTIKGNVGAKAYLGKWSFWKSAVGLKLQMLKTPDLLYHWCQ